MAAVCNVVGARKPTARSRVSNGRDILPDIDGRSVVARRYRDISNAIVSDIGGLDRCSEIRVHLIRRFAALACMAEQLEAALALGETIDLQDHALIASTMVRLATRIGIDRRAKNIVPDLKDYIEGRAAPIEVGE